ncbi:glycosyltransferase family 4 protein [Cesiribacter andamanensis]|uniref:D-inositol-3-phosphate glycosyltransferase n=1 Tax=Cesiribacter andamanensis AMV16 TaxID=1279009 RepID=M7NMP8_9BACT|nr:glycosyltransferase family 4 protein [Cesiribacter andamanensis]EMR03045.1 D-inositol-3-phosphate glycosyltransferase [Cesiribacter andamanensis AMV16]
MLTTKIKVLETIRQGKIGGGESHVIDLVLALDKTVYEPVVLSFTDGPMIDRLKAAGVKTYVLNTEWPFDVTIWAKVREILEAEDIDIIHAHGSRAHSNVLWPAKQLNIPIVYTVHGWSFHADQLPLTRWYRAMGERILTQNAQLTICVSDNNYQDASKTFPLPKATVVKYGINLDKYNPLNSYKDVRAELGVDKETVLIGYIARITAQKDPFTLLEAIAKLPKALNVKFLFIGDGDLKWITLKLARKMGIDSRIIFSDFRQDIPDVLKAIDIYCLPSLWEGLPIGLLEAMAMKKAIIATAVDGTKEVIKNRVNGLLIPPQEPDKLADALYTLASNKDLIRQYGEQASLDMQENHDIHKMTSRVEQLYITVLSAQNSPAHVTLPQVSLNLGMKPNSLEPLP